MSAPRRVRRVQTPVGYAKPTENRLADQRARRRATALGVRMALATGRLDTHG